MDITYRGYTDRIYTKTHDVSFEFGVGEIVVFILNGFEYRVENNKMWKWMIESKNYIKIDP